MRTAVGSFGYPLLPDSTENELRFHLHTSPHDSYRCQVLIYADSRFLVSYVFASDDLYRPEQREQVANLCNRISDTIPGALFYLQPLSDAVVCKSSLDASEGVSTEHVVRWLNRNGFPLRVWKSAYDRVRYEEVDASSALSASFIENSVYSESVLKSTRRAILKVHDGASVPSPDASPSLNEIIPRLTLL